MKKLAQTLLVLGAFGLASAHAHAHEFLVKPSTTTAKQGEKIAIAVVSSHVFMNSEELEEAKDVRVAVVANGRRTEIAVVPNAPAFVFEATLEAPTSAPFVISGTRLPQIWATTPNGVRPATKKTPGATNAFKMEKFAKTLVNLTPEATGWNVPLGDALEIVPVTNPAAAKPGDEIVVRVLYKGQPLATNVYATYDGFSGEENTYAYFTEGKADGTAKIKVTQAGLWMVRVQHAAAERTDEYDRAVARAVLVFAVK